jgi:hypothetical protein
MTRTDLHVIPGGAKPETVAQHVARLQREARQLAAQHVADLITAMGELSELAAAIGDGGDAYAPGARDIARRLADDLQGRVATLNAITGRTS